MSKTLLQWGNLFIEVLRHRRIRILVYHNIAENCADPFCVTPGMFADQMRLLAETRIPVISLEQALQALQQPADLHPAVVITFDDAFAGIYEHAIPILEEHHFPATISAVTGKTGQLSDWGEDSPSYPTLAWSDLSHLSSMGFAIASHTHTHAHLQTLDQNSLNNELLTSRDQIREHTGQNFIPLVYPYGEFGAREASITRQAGYPCGVAAGGLWGNGMGSDIYALRRELMMNTINLRTFKRIILGQEDFNHLVKNRIFRRLFRRK